MNGIGGRPDCGTGGIGTDDDPLTAGCGGGIDIGGGGRLPPGGLFIAPDEGTVNLCQSE